MSTRGIEVLAPGVCTLPQDAGRPGLRHLGIAMSGALDPWALALANLLVGNPGDAPALEITLSGPRLRFHVPARIALCGATIEASADGQAIPMARPVDVPAGCELRLGRCLDGARSYLAVLGGLRLPSVLGSASTDLRAGFEGLAGRPLRAGDQLPLAGQVDAPCLHVPAWWIDTAFDDRPRPSPDRVVRVIPGPDATTGERSLHGQAWKIAPDSNRQGLRLQGPALALADPGERVTEPVAPGCVQLPPGGQPIVLLADAQTHGGYPRIGQAIRADWPLLAQLRPGDGVRFAPCTAAEARAALARQRQRLHRIALALEARRARA